MQDAIVGVLGLEGLASVEEQSIIEYETIVGVAKDADHRGRRFLSL